MLEWLAANAATIIISALLSALVVLVIFRILTNKKKGNIPCGCIDCPMNKKCCRQSCKPE
ncbi:MAG TPA: FeoB-associated Cys-rich membrane protein [Bacillota bacterium]|nr:FeoB-associated Cys-rich membrane protein [Bacillota bacterium]